MNTQTAPHCFPYIIVRSAGLPVDAAHDAEVIFPKAELRLVKINEKINICNDSFYRELTHFFEILPVGDLKTATYNARKLFFQDQKLKPTYTSLVMGSDRPEARALLSTLADLVALQNDQKQTEIQLREVYEAALSDSLTRLGRDIQAEDFQRALLFSSHDLWRAAQHLPAFISWGATNKKDRQVAFSLLQYRERMRYKTSPLSRFTTLFAWPLPSESADELPFMLGLDSKVAISPNVALLPLLYGVLLQDPVFYGSLTLRLNPSLTLENGSYTWLYHDGETECFQNSTPNPALDIVIEIFQKNGYRSQFSIVLPLILTEIEASEADLKQYLFELLDLGLLEWILPEQGLTPSWSSNLYQYIGFLPQASQTLVEAAFLLQWLRTASKTMGYQPLAEMKETQENARSEFKNFLERHGSVFPENLKAEHLFYEDVEQYVHVDLTLDDMEPMLHNLLATVESCQPKSSALRARFVAFAEAHKDASPSFMGLCRHFLDAEKKENIQGVSAQKPSKVGFLLQFFKEGNEIKAVVNAVFPGGGKLMARWVHLFPMGLRRVLETWPSDTALTYPWQAWSNANFQPSFSKQVLAVPQSRIIAPDAKDEIRLSDLELRSDERGVARLYCADKQQFVTFNDLGLEDPATRPPAMQLLADMGTPTISRFDLFAVPDWQSGGEGWQFRPRVSQGQLIWYRKTWRIEPTFWNTCQPNTEAFVAFGFIRQKLKEILVPAHFFATVLDSPERAKPQHFDQNDPLSMALFQKECLGKRLEITEMLPLPHQQVTARAGGAVVVSEMMVEMELSF